MSYTFGAAVTDRITATRTNCSTTSVFLLTGWFKPTTLTAGRGLFGFGTLGITNITIGATTSEIKLVTDHATTDSAFNTSGLGLVVDVWQFVAVLYTPGLAVCACRVWIGTLTDPPKEVTVTATTAPVGAFVAASVVTIGNSGSAASLAFQGMIEQCTLANQASAGVNGYLPTATIGTITQAEADYILAAHVAPTWKGEPPLFTAQQNANGLCEVTLFDLSAQPALIILKTQSSGVAVGPINPTISGVTWNEERSGGKLMQGWPCTQPMPIGNRV